MQNSQNQQIIQLPNFNKYNSPASQSILWNYHDPYEWQVAVWNECWKRGAQVAVRTSNEAQPHDTMIPTPNGVKRFGDLKQYDWVFGSNGELARVLYVFEHGEKDVYRIEFDDGTSTLACGDHLWIYKPKSTRHSAWNRDRWFEFTTEQILKLQGSVATPQTSGAIPTCKPVKYSARHTFYIKPYTLGVLIGDGCLRRGASFTNTDKELIDRVQSELPKGYKFTNPEAITYDVVRESRFGSMSNHVKNELESLGLLGHKAVDKFIPHKYMMGTVEQRIDLLRGLMDSDGTISSEGNHSTFCTVSEKLRDDVITLVRSLGGKATYTSRIPKFKDVNGNIKEGQMAYNVLVRLIDICPFYIKRKAERWKPFEKVGYKFINKITPAGRMNVRCIKTSAPDHSYLTNDFIVTHNSGKTSIVIPLLVASFASAFPASQVVITSASERQLKKQLEPALKSFFSNRVGWTVTAGNIEAPSIRGLPPSNITWFATKSGEMFEGFHVRHFKDSDGNMIEAPLLIIIDEAKSVKHDIFVAVERCNPTVQLVISTCGEDSGDFYEACMNKNGLWVTSSTSTGREVEFKIPWTMCPHLMKGHVYARKKALLETKGRNDPDVASILLAEFFRGGTYMAFEEYDMKMLKDAMSGIYAEWRGSRRAFCDFSGGGDEMTFSYRNGNRIHQIIAWRPDSATSPSVTAEKYIKLFKQYNLSPSDIYADNGGLGQLIINELGLKGWNINRVNPNVGAVYKEGYTDRYAELHWNFKELLHKGALILPQDEVLIEQCRLRRYTRSNTDQNRIKMEPKKDAKLNRREHSPDRLDTVIQLCDDMPIIPTLDRYQKPLTICPSVDEYWKMMEEDRRKRDDMTEQAMMDEW